MPLSTVLSAHRKTYSGIERSGGVRLTGRPQGGVRGPEAEDIERRPTRWKRFQHDEECILRIFHLVVTSHTPASINHENVLLVRNRLHAEARYESERQGDATLVRQAFSDAARGINIAGLDREDEVLVQVRNG